jgi:hypothetical protein
MAPSSPERPFQKGAEMVTLTDPILELQPPPRGIELPPLGAPESLETPGSYVSTAGATVMTSKELGMARYGAVPASPGFTQFGEQVSHMTGRFVLSASSDLYRIWRFQSAEPALEFPVTEAGWTNAWTTFRSLDSQAA